MNKEIIVLNSSYLPLGKINLERAITLIFLDKAHSVVDSDNIIRSIKSEMKVPEIIRLPNVSFIRRKFQHPTKKNIFKRDNYTCYYCGSQNRNELTIDHIIPRVKFAEIKRFKGLEYEVDSWQNVLCACRKCNQHKSDKLLSEMGIPDFIGKEPLFDLEISWANVMEKLQEKE